MKLHSTQNTGYLCSSHHQDLQLLLLSTIKIQLWTFRVTAALLWLHTAHWWGWESAGCTLCFHSCFRRSAFMFFHTGESLKKCIHEKMWQSFSLLLIFIGPTAHVWMLKTPNNRSRIYATPNEAGIFYYMLAIVVSMFWLTCSTRLVCWNESCIEF